MVKPQLKKQNPKSSLSRLVPVLLILIAGIFFIIASEDGNYGFGSNESNSASLSLRKEMAMDSKEPTAESGDVLAPTRSQSPALEPAVEVKVDGSDQSLSSCEWRPEPLLGNCDGISANEEIRQAHPTAVACEEGCCAQEGCFAFQFRALEGCMFGMKDSRLGAEKDGPTSWCEPRAPATWKGQWVRTREGGEAVEGACSTDQQQANFNELSGQCFGLGPKRQTDSNTPEACQEACCATDDCKIWQWRRDAGCFFHNGAHFCKEVETPGALEPFYGKRKVVQGRRYEPYAYSSDFADLAGTEFKLQK